MPHRLLALLDSAHIDNLVAMLGAILTTSTASFALLAEAAPGTSTDELRMLLVPILGSIIASTGAFMLRPSNEAPRKTAGRAIYSVAIGSSGPVAFSFFSDYGKQVAEHPVSLFLAGMLVTTLVYILIKPIIDKLFSTADDMSGAVIDEAMKRLHLPNKKEREP